MCQAEEFVAVTGECIEGECAEGVFHAVQQDLHFTGTLLVVVSQQLSGDELCLTGMEHADDKRNKRARHGANNESKCRLHRYPVWFMRGEGQVRLCAGSIYRESALKSRKAAVPIDNTDEVWYNYSYGTS